MKKLYFMSGTNASGKSSIARFFILNDPNVEHIQFAEYGTQISVCSKYNLIIIGKYSLKASSGGCDTIRKKEYMQKILDNIWERDEDILMEGHLIGTKTWTQDLLEINKRHGSVREIQFVHPNTLLETCFKRIEKRSGRKQAQLKGNGKNVISKYNGILRFKKWLEGEGIKCITLDAERLETEMLCLSLIHNP